MKKIFTIFFIFITCCIHSWAFVVDSIPYKKIGNNEVEITISSVEMPKNLVIPERIVYDGVTYKVTRIGEQALQYRAFSSVSIPNTVTMINRWAFQGTALSYIVIPKSVTTIASYAFLYCNLKSIDFGTGVQSIVNESFSDIRFTNLSFPASLKKIGKKCFRSDNLTLVSCAAVVPPTLADTTSFYFLNVYKNKVDTLLVPTESVEAYKQSLWAKMFKYILPHDFVEDTLSSVTEIVDGSSVSISFRVNPNVVRYNINLYQEGNPFAEYIVNNKGEIIYQDFLSRLSKKKDDLLMPELNGESLCKSRKIINDTTTNSTEYFVITINNLQRGYHYTYTIRGFDAAGVPIYNDMGEFSTIGECIMHVMPDTTNSLKILIDDQVLILRNGKTYTMQGQEVK